MLRRGGAPDEQPPPQEEVSRPPSAVLLALLGGVVLAMGLTVLAGPRAGGLLLGADLFVAGLLRLTLPVRVVGALAVRSRFLDVLVLLTLATACTALAWVVPTEP